MVAIQRGIGYEQVVPTMGVDDIVNLCANTDPAAGSRNRERFDKLEAVAADSRRTDVQYQISLIGKKQDPFECIADKLQFFRVPDRIKSAIMWQLDDNPMYQELVRACQSVQPKDPYKKCNAYYPYRSYDGTCNNLENPFWGSPLQCLNRLLPSHYEDSHGLRKSVNGGPLPKPRKVSMGVRLDLDTPLFPVSNLFVFFGLVLTLDMILSAPSTDNGQVIECCPPEADNHPMCAEILLEKNDPFFLLFNKTCINFHRNAKCATCQIGKRDQMTEITAYIDGSAVYSNNETSATKIRTNDGTGKLKMQDSRCGPLLPKDPQRTLCGSMEKGEFCFQAGDMRVNQNAPLMMLQTVFLRLHNLLAEKLKEVNPSWGEETLFQEARKLLGAIFQNIVYRDYLPILLGAESMSKNDLYVRERGRTFYDPHIDPTMFIEFSTVAFRIHSIIPSFVDGQTQMKDTYGNATLLYEGLLGTTLQGMALTTFNRFFVSDISNLLHRDLKGQYGQDLLAMDVQRGRDHGIPPYPKLVEYCTNGATKIKQFSDLISLIDEQNIRILQSIYEDVNDIDAEVGILFERKTIGKGIVGSTANCIIAKQFFNLKYGDRFYFEHGDGGARFSDNQLREIRKVGMSKVLCDTTEITNIAKYPFMLPFQSNPTVSCNDLPGINFNFWKESGSMFDGIQG